MPVTIVVTGIFCRFRTEYRLVEVGSPGGTPSPAPAQLGQTAGRAPARHHQERLGHHPAVIFDSPTSRSVKVMGTSRTSKSACTVRQARSI